MKANELRIGNYVKTIQGNYKVSKIGYNELYICPFLTDDELPIFINTLNPIQLTEEWLLKFGYKKVNTVNNNTEVFEKKFSYTVYLTNGVLSMSFGAVKIKYVHQLQNLYFALTGEELTIKQ